MKFYEIAVETTTELSELVAYILQEVTGQSVAIYDSTDLEKLNIEYIEQGVTQSGCVVKGYLGIDEIDKVELIKQELIKANLASNLNVVCKDDVEYLDKWKEYFTPIDIDNLTVVPYGYKGKICKEPIFIDTCLAFGTGQHETTSMCLSFLQKINCQGKTALDIGCGSGILSVAVCKLGAKQVVAVDYDDEAVNTTLKNAKINHFDQQIIVKNSNLLEKVEGKFDIVMANITIDILSKLKDSLPKVLKKDSLVIFSGILTTQLDKLYSVFNLSKLDTISQGEWSATLLINKWDN
ncbi:MAG: 50S ribosomal protein L11 methyltransferase [Clostridia bacterium]